MTMSSYNDMVWNVYGMVRVSKFYLTENILVEYNLPTSSNITYQPVYISNQPLFT